MHCASCEPLLDAYLEGTLQPRQMHQVSRHLRTCTECEALLGELRVIDALLTTARAPGSVVPDVTSAVVRATRTTRPRVQPRIPIWLPLLGYLAIAWALLALVQIRSHDVTRLSAALFETGARNVAAIGAAVHALAPATPVAAAAVTGVLLVDVILLLTIFYGYRRLRPLLAFHLAKGRRP